MANWSFNTLAIKGNKQDVIDFFNKGLKSINNEFYLSAEMDSTEIGNILKEVCGGGIGDLSLRSWLPMPKTFIDFDTTNHIESFDFWQQRMLGKALGKLIPSRRKIYRFKKMNEKERLAEYEKYIKDWEKAKVYQENKYGAIGWYEYNVKTLGTKWNSVFDDVACEDNDGIIIVTLHCETAWCYPVMWLNTMQYKYPSLNFFCYAWEESYVYNGYFVANGDDWIENEPDIYAECEEELGITEDNEGDKFAELEDAVIRKKENMLDRYMEFVRTY